MLAHVRHYSPLAIAFVIFLAIPPFVEAAPICATRLQTKPDYHTFKVSIQKTLIGTHLLEQSFEVKVGKDNVFNHVTFKFYAEEFSPKDTVCILDSTETLDSSADSPIWNTYWGTAILLSPFAVNTNETRYGPKDLNVYTELAEQIARAAEPSLCSWPYAQPPTYRTQDTLPYEECHAEYEQDVARRTRAIIADLPPEVLSTSNSTIVEIYDPNTPDSDSNAAALEAFISAVATLETLNSPFYQSPIPTEQHPESPQFRVFDPINGARLPATSLIDFLGRVFLEKSLVMLFREYGHLADEFDRPGPLDSHVPPAIRTVSRMDYDVVSEKAFPYDDVLEQMVRSYVCQDGGYAGVRIDELDSRALLYALQEMACPIWQLNGKEVIDLTDSLLMNAKLVPQLGLISAEDARARMEQILIEIKQIKLEQSETLNQIHKYSAEGAFQSRLQGLRRELARLESSRNDLLGRAAEIAGAIGAVYAGYGGVGGLLGGMEEIEKLYSKMPSGSLREMIKYSHEHREEFSAATDITANGAAKVVGALNALGGFLGGGSSSKEIEQVKSEIRAIEGERRRVFREIRDRSLSLEKQWIKATEELFWIREGTRSVERNVARILEDAIANKMIFSLQTENFYGEFTRCIKALDARLVSPEGFSFSAIQAACGNIQQALDEVKECLDEDEGTKGTDLVIEGRTKVFRIGKNTNAKDCYENWLWRANRVHFDLH